MPTSVRKADHVYEVLRTLIRDAALPTDVPLSTRELAQKFEISRTPIHQALQLLEQSALLVHRLGDGYFPRIPTAGEFESAYTAIPVIAEAVIARANGGRRPRLPNHHRSASLAELDQLEKVQTVEAPARKIHAVFLGLARTSIDTARLSEALDVVATLAYLRAAEATLPDHTTRAASIVRQYRAYKYDELLEQLRAYSAARVPFAAELSRLIPRPRGKLTVDKR